MIDVTNVMTHQIEENFKAKYRKSFLSINKNVQILKMRFRTKVNEELEKAKNQLISDEANKHQDRLSFLEKELQEMSSIKKAIKLESELLKLQDEAENSKASSELLVQRGNFRNKEIS